MANNNNILQILEQEDMIAKGLIEPLVQACIRGSVEDVHELLASAEQDIDVSNLVNRTNSQGMTPITATLLLGSAMPADVVTSERQEAVLQELEEFEADFEAPDGNGMYPVFLSLCADFPVTFFVMNRGNPAQVIDNNVNLLMYAASMGLNDVIEIMKIDIENKNERDAKGNTALHHAILQDLQLPTRNVRYHPGEVVGLLCTVGVDPLIENNEGQIAYDLAYERHMYDVALELRHCEFPDELLRRIKIQMGPDTTINFIINHRDTVLSVKRALFFDDAREFDLIYPNFRQPNGKPAPNAMKVLEDEREFGDYNIKEGELLIVQPRIRSGIRGGKRKTQRKRSGARR